ncbi:MAG TPA: SgcJ/EcaC family oxidoreductase [Vicinamibacterales bacterium]|nr:SgcJ/EcaC family oxidoreductase [Vicinamibacterales bacterium]
MNSDEQAVRNVIELWHRATGAGDVETVLRLMSEDVVFLVPGKPPIRGRSEFEAGLRTLLRLHRIDSTGDVHEVQVADGLAYSWTQLSVRITPLAGGRSNARSGSALSIFRKQVDGSWLLVRDANLLT